MQDMPNILDGGVVFIEMIWLKYIVVYELVRYRGPYLTHGRAGAVLSWARVVYTELGLEVVRLSEIHHVPVHGLRVVYLPINYPRRMELVRI